MRQMYFSFKPLLVATPILPLAACQMDYCFNVAAISMDLLASYFCCRRGCLDQQVHFQTQSLNSKLIRTRRTAAGTLAIVVEKKRSGNHQSYCLKKSLAASKVAIEER